MSITHRCLLRVCRPWEAPENLLTDAGVELGVNYPLPVISLEESEHALSQAMAAIQQSLVEVNDKVRQLPVHWGSERVYCTLLL